MHDTLGRRYRDITQSTGKHIIRDLADLDWFEMIHRIGPQTTSALYERTRDVRRSRQDALRRMRDLRHEDDSDWGGPTLAYPLQQTRTWRPDKNLTVYDITKKAERALRDAGRFHEHAPTTNHNEWKHDFMGSSVAASIYLATLRSDCQFIFHDEIVERLGAKTFGVRYRFVRRDGSAAEREAIIRPDGFFGIRYPNGDERIFIREEDCATERNDTDAPDVKNHKHKMLQYSDFLGRGETRKRYFGDRRVVVLNTFSNPTKMRNVIGLLLDLSKGKGSNFILFRSWEAFGLTFQPPHPDLSLFGEWERAGNPPLDIAHV